MGRRDLRALAESLPQPLLSPWGGVFSALVRAGHACHARWELGEARYAHRAHWLPDLPWSPPPPADANTTLARRYFRAYGPATLRDFAYWRGVTVAEARPWVASLGAELTEVQDAAGSVLLADATDLPELAQTPPTRAKWPVRLLGRFDPLLLGHKQKDWVVPAPFYARVWRPAGHIEGVILEQGRAVGTWRYDRLSGDRIVISAFPFHPLPERVRRSLATEAKGVARFFGLTLSEVRVSEPLVPLPSMHS